MRPLEAVRPRLRGLVVLTVTPFDDSGALALPAVARILDYLAEGGVAGIIPGDLVGEFFSLTLDERRALLAESVQAARGRMTVIALTADASLQNAIELARFAREAGADVIKLGLPYPYTPSESAMLDVYRRIDDGTDSPFLVESSDDLVIPLSVIAALCERSNFVGLEELGTDIGRLDRIFREFSDRLVILPSGETALLFLSLMGTPGLIAAESNFAPRFMGEFLAACQARTLDRALELFGRRRRYRDLFRAELARGRPMFTPYAKAAMELLGLPVGKPRFPHEALRPAEIARLGEVLRREFGLSVPAM